MASKIKRLHEKYRKRGNYELIIIEVEARLVTKLGGNEMSKREIRQKRIEEDELL